MIKLSNGWKFEYELPSGAMGYDGRGWLWERPLIWAGKIKLDLFTIVLKTVKRWPWPGNYRWYQPWDTFRFIPGPPPFHKCIGTINAFGLRCGGIEAELAKAGPHIYNSPLQLIGSVYAENPSETGEMVEMMGRYLTAVELNASCPNTSEGVLRDADRIVACCQVADEAAKLFRPKLDLGLKLSVAQRSIAGTILPQVRGIVKSLKINSVPYKLAGLPEPSPLAHHGGGGVSGKVVQHITWDFAEWLEQFGIPVVWPSMWEKGDPQRARALGAPAVSFGALQLAYPTRPTQIVLDDLERNS